MKKNEWWTEKYGYFGSFYLKADTMRDSHINKEDNLKKRTKKEVDGVIKLLNIRKDDKILDCPCGYGRHSIELSSRGYDITGVDINSKHLNIAKSVKTDVKIPFIKGNMIGLQYKSEFDVVINLFASFGFFETDIQNELVLKNFYNALKTDGKFLMHIDINISKLKQNNGRHESEKKLLTGEILKINDIYNPKTKKLNGVWLISGKNKKERGYSVRIYTKDEFEELCKKIGFSSVKTVGGWDGSDYKENSDNMIVVATK